MRSSLAALPALLPLLLAPPRPAHADGERLLEVLSAGSGFFARRDDGVVICQGRYGVNGLTVKPFEIPRDSSPLVSDGDSAFTVAPRAPDRPRPLLVELRLAPTREKIKNELPDGFDGRPVGVDREWVYFDDGQRWDRRAERLVGGARDGIDGREVMAVTTGPWFDFSTTDACAGTTFLLRHVAVDGATSWSVARRVRGRLVKASLPPAATARLGDMDLDRVVVILDDSRAIRLAPCDLSLVDEVVADGPVRSLHPDRSGAWIVVGATGSCPAALVRVGEDGRRRRIVPLPGDVRVVASSLVELALAAPDSPAHRLALVTRDPRGDFEMRTAPLRDDADRVVAGLKWAPAMVGLAVGFVPIAMVGAAADEMGTADQDELDRKQRARRAKQRAKVVPRVQECLGALPDPGACPVSW